MATQGSANQTSLFSGRRKTFVRSASDRCKRRRRQLPQRSCSSGALSPSPGGHDLPKRSSGRLVHMVVQDQRFVDGRPDVATWQTGILQDDVTVAGNVVAKLFASTTGSDADWIVKLIDVYPGKVEEDWKLSGFELMIAEEIFRGRYRDSYEKPEAITPNQVTLFTVDLHS